MTRWNRVEDVFSFQRDMDRLFNEFWSDLPSRPATSGSPTSFRANATEDGWQIDIPIPGIDPKDVTLDVAGNTLSIRAEASGDMQANRYEQSFTIPQFLDLEKVSATHRHGMLRLTVPLKESVKPRRITIETQDEGQKQLVSR
jgi:HSP20 family protein